jgi:excisionase family DNA binding protein
MSIQTYIQETLSQWGEPTLDSSPDYANAVAALKVKLCEAGHYDLSLSLPVEECKRSVSAVAQFRRVLSALESPALPDGEVLDPPEVARLVGCSPDTVRDWIRSGQLRAANVARGSRPLWKIQRDDLDTFLESRNHTAIPRAARRRVDPDIIEFF